MPTTTTSPKQAPDSIERWAQAAQHAIAAGQWHRAWSTVLDSALPLPATAQQQVLDALDAWDALPNQGPTASRQSIVAGALDVVCAAHANHTHHFSSSTTSQHVRGCRLVKRYKKSQFVLGPVDVDVKPGHILGLVGENGNGKTTLLRLLAADLAPDEGQLEWGDATPDPYTLRSQLAYIPQRPHPWGGRLMDHLQFAARSYGVTGVRNRCLVELVIARLSLRSFRGHQWKQLSSGYKMRFELARALLTRPRVLLLDEPLANLDINAQQTLLTDLQSLAQSPWHPMAMVLSSQQLYEVEKVADAVLFLEQGQPRSVQERFAQMAGCAVEFEVECPASTLDAWLSRLPTHTHQVSGHTHIVSFHEECSAAQFLRLAVDADLPLTYYRDITRSTRRLFVED